MKRLVLLSCLFFFTLFCSIDSLCFVAEPVQYTLFSWANFEEIFKERYAYESFCVDTLVKTPCGYKPIQNINEGGIVVTCNDQEKTVVSIAIQFVKHYVVLVVNDTVMYAGYDQ